MTSLKTVKFFVIIMFISIYSVVYIVTTNDRDEHIKFTLNQQIEYLENNYKVSKNHYTIVSKNIYHFLLNKPELLKLFYQAKHAKNETELADIRNKMYLKTSTNFEYLRKSGVIIMLFSFENNKTFLRVHKPTKFNDDLSAVRYSFTYVNSTKKAIKGFEQGKISHAFRNIFPLYYKGEFLGSVDIAFSSEILQENMISLHNIDTHFILNKNILETKTWEAQKQIKYIQSIENDNFLFALTPKQPTDKAFSQEKLALNAALKEEINKNLMHKSSFALYNYLNDKIKIIAFLAIKNIKDKKTVAYIVSYTDSHYLKGMLKEYILINALSFIILLILSILIYKNIKQKNFLQIEVDKKTKDIKSVNENLQIAIKKQNTAFEILFEKPSDGILMIENNHFTQCNESIVNMLGYSSKDEILQSHPSNLSPEFQPDGRKSFEKAEEMMKIAIEKGVNNFEWLHKRANGENFWTDITLTPISLVDKEIVHVVWKDISHRKELEKKLEYYTKELESKISHEVEKNKKQQQTIFKQSRLAQMGEMISMIAHQWRQPLSAISSTVINLQTKLELETFDLNTKEGVQKAKEYFIQRLANIEDYVQSLTTTIDDFRNFYKPDKKFKILTINSTIKKAFNIIETSMRSNNINIIKSCESKIKIKLHDHEMMQVFLNIFKNAQDNFQEKETKSPTIEIISYDTEDSVIVEIIDNGGGIPEDIIDKIFDPYFSTKNEKNGTGLGLYMSKTVIEDHHKGSLNVENFNNGTKFIIEIKY